MVLLLLLLLLLPTTLLYYYNYYCSYCNYYNYYNYCNYYEKGWAGGALTPEQLARPRGSGAGLLGGGGLPQERFVAHNSSPGILSLSSTFKMQDPQAHGA